MLLPPTPAQTVQSEREKTLFILASVETTNKNMGKNLCEADLPVSNNFYVIVK